MTFFGYRDSLANRAKMGPIKITIVQPWAFHLLTLTLIMPISQPIATHFGTDYFIFIPKEDIYKRGEFIHLEHNIF